MSAFREEARGIVVHLRLTPKGGRDSIDGVAIGDDGRALLLARVRAVPEDGLANAALIALLSKTLKLRKSAFEIVSGATSRQKTVLITGEQAGVLTCLAQLCGQPAP
jgi:uncharacterized protein